MEPEQLKLIEEYSAALMFPDEIAILIGVAPGEQKSFCYQCVKVASSDVYQAYQRGKLLTKFELRKTVIKLAKAGSPAAEPLADKYLIDQKTAELNA